MCLVTVPQMAADIGVADPVINPLASQVVPDRIESQALFDAMTAGVKTRGKDMVMVGGAMFQFIISDGGEAGKFTLDLRSGNGDARAGEDPQADVTITIADAVFMAMADGSLDGIQALMSGKLIVKGDMTLWQQLSDILLMCLTRCSGSDDAVDDDSGISLVAGGHSSLCSVCLGRFNATLIM